MAGSLNSKLLSQQKVLNSVWSSVSTYTYSTTADKKQMFTLIYNSLCLHFKYHYRLIIQSHTITPVNTCNFRHINKFESIQYNTSTDVCRRWCYCVHLLYLFPFSFRFVQMSELTQTKRFLDSQTDEAAAVAGGDDQRPPRFTIAKISC